MPALSVFQLTCPQCESVLELPDEAARRLVKCPACAMTFVPQDNTANGSSKSSPDLHTHTVAFHEVWVATWRVFRKRWAILMLAFFLTTLGGLASHLPGPWLPETGSHRYLIQGFALLISLAISQYLNLGMTRTTLAIARQEKAPLRSLFPSMRVFLVYLSGPLLLITAMASVSGCLWGLGNVLSKTLDSSGLTVATVMLICMVNLGIFLVIAMLFWSYPFIASEGKFSLRQNLRLSSTIARKNLVTSILTLGVATLLGVMGLLALVIGIFVAGPLARLVLAVAYLKITGAPITASSAPSHTSHRHP